MTREDRAARRRRRTVRRAVLPWRRRVRPSHFDFTPGGGFGALVGDPLGFILAAVLVPLWLPAAVVAVPAAVELVVALALTPVACLRRRVRQQWPVQVLEGSREVYRENCPTFAAAGRRALELEGEAPDTAPPSRGG
jgi:hypothetical protein